MADKVLSLYSKGMSASDIVDELRDIYDPSVSTSLISRITNRIMPIEMLPINWTGDKDS